jgi:hypothetical protein
MAFLGESLDHSHLAQHLPFWTSMYLLSNPCLLDRTYVVTIFVLSICLLYCIAARIVPLHIYLICVVVSFLVERDAGVVVIEPENVVFQHCTHLTFFSNACSLALGVGAPTSGREKGAFLKSFMVILLPMDCGVVRSLEHRHLFHPEGRECAARTRRNGGVEPRLSSLEAGIE